jgi:phosphomannomutase
MSLVFPSGLMVSVSGFRGTVGDVLTPELMTTLAAGFGAFLREEAAQGAAQGVEQGAAHGVEQADNRITVLLGRDSRTTGAMIESAAVAGLQSVGVDVVKLGIVPTPTLLLAVRHHGASGALGVTASHNPAQWNAFKFAGADGTFLDADRMLRFQAFLREREIPRVTWDQIGGVRDDDEAVDRHLERILALPFLDVGAIRARRFHVALDCVHGAGGRMVPRLLEALGCKVEGIGLEVDGRFPRDPEPTAANLGDLGDLVRATGAELGFAVDPDVDRLSLVDDTGHALGEDLTLALCADVVLRRTSGPWSPTFPPAGWWRTSPGPMRPRFIALRWGKSTWHGVCRQKRLSWVERGTEGSSFRPFTSPATRRWAWPSCFSTWWIPAGPWPRRPGDGRSTTS